MSRDIGLVANTAVMVVGGVGMLVLKDAERGLGTDGKSNVSRNGVEAGSLDLLNMGVGGGMAGAAVAGGGGGIGTF
jgi:hypothetical protein